MFMPAMILMRLTPGRADRRRAASGRRAARRRCGTGPAARSSCGSMWMSEARSRSACVISMLTICTTGTSSAAVSSPACSLRVRAPSVALKAATCAAMPGSTWYVESIERRTSVGVDTKKVTGLAAASRICWRTAGSGSATAIAIDPSLQAPSGAAPRPRAISSSSSPTASTSAVRCAGRPPATGTAWPALRRQRVR